MSFFPRKSYLPNYKLVIFTRQAIFHDFSGTFPSHTFNISEVIMHPTVEVILESMVYNIFNTLNNF